MGISRLATGIRDGLVERQKYISGPDSQVVNCATQGRTALLISLSIEVEKTLRHVYAICLSTSTRRDTRCNSPYRLSAQPRIAFTSSSYDQPAFSAILG